MPRAKQKSDTLSNNKRTWPARTVRDETAQGFKLDGLVEWVSKAGTGWTLRLVPGEPSRALHACVKEHLNWSLYVLKALASDAGRPATLQLYPDRGPGQRYRKGQGKGNDGKGRGKGQPNGRGKGKGRAAPAAAP